MVGSRPGQACQRVHVKHLSKNHCRMARPDYLLAVFIARKLSTIHPDSQSSVTVMPRQHSTTLSRHSFPCPCVSTISTALPLVCQPRFHHAQGCSVLRDLPQPDSGNHRLQTNKQQEISLSIEILAAYQTMNINFLLYCTTCKICSTNTPQKVIKSLLSPPA